MSSCSRRPPKGLWFSCCSEAPLAPAKVELDSIADSACQRTPLAGRFSGFLGGSLIKVDRPGTTLRRGIGTWRTRGMRQCPCHGTFRCRAWRSAVNSDSARIGALPESKNVRPYAELGALHPISVPPALRIGNNPEKIISLIFAVLAYTPGLPLDGARRGLIENLHRAVNPSHGDRRGQGQGK